MPKIPSLEEMLKTGMHFGHSVSKRHPKMEPYIFGARQGVHIINLEETTRLLEQALDFVRKTVAQNGIVLFLGTKKQAQSIIKKYALECGTPYVSERWIGGAITNFGVIKKQVKKFKDLKAKKESGELKKYTKREQLDFDREIERLDSMVGGIETLEKLPQAIFVVDIKHEETAVREASTKDIPLVAICDTNVDANKVKYPVPANDDAQKSIEMIVKLFSEAVKEGKEEAKIVKEKALSSEKSK